MVEEQFDNSDYGIYSYEAIDIIKSFFNSNLPLFALINSYADSPYWGIKYSYKEIRISMEGDTGYSTTIIINGEEYPLWQYDRNVIKANKTNKKNILYALNVIKKFLSETSS